jgi:transcription elongation GreA/GreB family factor
MVEPSHGTVRTIVHGHEIRHRAACLSLLLASLCLPRATPRPGATVPTRAVLRDRPAVTLSCSKESLKEELGRLLQSELEAIERAQLATIEGATHEEAKPENDKDTRALEQSYLARGQATRVHELREAVAQVRALTLRAFQEGDPIAIGALVAIGERGKEAVLFVSPHGGGSRLAGGLVQVITPASPLGRAIVGRRAGDSCELVLRGKTRDVVVASVA